MTKETSNVLPYDKNPKLHPPEQVLLIARSIARFGWRQPIVVNRDNVIVVGHGRWMAYQEYKERLKIKDPWIVNDEGETVSGQAETKPLSIKEEQAYRLADNQINALSGQDMELVEEEWNSIDDQELQEITGFDADIFVDKDDTDDDTPPLPKEPKSKVGDIYKLGMHTLIVGDSTNKETIATLMDGNKADMVFTDPPYNIDIKGSGKNTKNKILNDNMDDDAFQAFLDAVFQRFEEASKKGAPWYVFHSPTTQDQFKGAIEKTAWRVKTQLIWNKPFWNKPSAGMGMNEYRAKHEPFFYCVNGDKTPFYGDRTGTSVWNFHKGEDEMMRWVKAQLMAEKQGRTTIWSQKREPVGDYVHPTQKPVELISHALHNSSKREDIVLDLFGGSGATLIACEKFARECRMCELDTRYADVIVSRWCQYTGNKKVVLNGKEIVWE